MDFYRRVLPACGPYTVLTGVTGPDGKLTEARHWNSLKSHTEVEELVQRQSMLPLNVFVAMGSYAGRNRQDPIAKRCFYIDLDGKEFGSVETALRDLSVFVRATGLPRPSLYVHSGRGVHVYWVLDKDVPIDQWLVVAKALKDKCEELEFKADGAVTADPARILRAPGTLNRKGKDPIPCRVLTDNGTSYSLQEIADALRVKQSSGMEKLAALGRIEDLKTKRDFKKLAADEVRDMLDFIQLPTNDNREDWIEMLCAVQDWGDKSEESFEIFHTWSMGQPGYSTYEDTYKTWMSFNPGGGYTIGTLIKKATESGWTPLAPEDPVTPIAAPTLAQQLITPASVAAAPSAPQVSSGIITSALMVAAAHAVKALGRDRFEHNDAVHWLANEFVLVTDQDGVFYSLTNRLPMSRTVIDDLLTRYMPLNGSGIPINSSAILKRYGTVHSVNSLGFHPGAPSVYVEGGRSFVNQYVMPDMTVPMTQPEIDLMNDFWWNYCFPRAADKEFGEYLMQAYAHLVQKPAIKIASAPVMVSKEYGTGKTTIMYDIPEALAGQHVSKIVSNKVLRSSFNDYINGAHFLHFDEIHINGKWDSDDTANSMKSLITGVNVEVHPKGMKTFNIPNRLFITATSNYEDAISLPADDERRWGVYYLSPLRVWQHPDQKVAYFKALHTLISDSNGPGKLRWFFAQVDISKFNPQAAPPTTEAKKNMVRRSQLHEVQIIKEMTIERSGIFAKDIFTTEEVRQLLSAETDKTYSRHQVREFIMKALPYATGTIQIRHANGERVIPWTWNNLSHWQCATADELRDELKRPPPP